jgi:hypothetical protein
MWTVAPLFCTHKRKINFGFGGPASIHGFGNMEGSVVERIQLLSKLQKPPSGQAYEFEGSVGILCQKLG